MGHDDFVCLLRNHRAGLLVLGVDVAVQVLDDLGELLLGLLVQIGDSDTSTLSANPAIKGDKREGAGPSGKDCIVGMLGGHVRCRLSGEIIEFDGRDALSVSLHPLINVAVGGEMCLIDSGDDFLRDGDRVNVVRVETITESTHARRDLNKQPRQHQQKGKSRAEITVEETNLVELNAFLPPISLHTVNIPREQSMSRGHKPCKRTSLNRVKVAEFRARTQRECPTGQARRRVNCRESREDEAISRASSLGELVLVGRGVDVGAESKEGEKLYGVFVPNPPLRN